MDDYKWLDYLYEFRGLQTENSTDDEYEPEETALWIRVLINVVLFIFIICMTSSVNIKKMRENFKSRGIIVGLFVQFFLAPLIGFVTVKIPIFADEFNTEEKIILVTIMSSPGGTVSNLLCSVFNADLGLSVSMSAVSTLASVVFLPLNMFLYVKRGAGADADISYVALSYTVVTVVIGVFIGMWLHTKIQTQRTLNRLNRIGSICGISLAVQGLILSQSEEPITNKSPTFAIGVLIPALGITVIAWVLSLLSRLPRPQTVAVTVEAICQNIAIANAMALGTFPFKVALKALNVSVMYGLWQWAICFILLFTALKTGWTLSPANENICVALFSNYQPGILEPEEEDDETVIEDGKLEVKADGAVIEDEPLEVKVDETVV